MTKNYFVYLSNENGSKISDIILGSVFSESYQEAVVKANKAWESDIVTVLEVVSNEQGSLLEELSSIDIKRKNILRKLKNLNA
jgi:hypothetical protein